MTLRIPEAGEGVRILTEIDDEGFDDESNDFLGLKTNGRNSIDWVKAEKVTSVKDQGQCGSCWAFATLGSIESMSMINNVTNPDYSEQDLVCLLYTSPSPRDLSTSRMPSSA